MSKQRKMVLIAAAVGVIAMFLPWWSISLGLFGGGSVNGLHGIGIVAFLCFIGAGVLAVMGEQTKNFDEANWMLALIAGGLSLLITLISFLNAPEFGDRGIGLYLALAAAAGIVAMTYLHRNAGYTLQSGFEALKRKFNGQQAASTTSAQPTTKVINPTNDPSKPVV